MSAYSPGPHAPLVTVLYIGSGSNVPVERFQAERIGVVAVQSVARGLRLLGNFRVAAVICDVPDLMVVTRFAATQTPVILLAPKDVEWGGPEVTVVNRRTPVVALAALVRQIAATPRVAPRHSDVSAER